MKNLVEMVSEREHKLKSADDILHKAEQEDRNLTEEQSKDIEDLLTESKEIAKKIEEREAHEAIHKTVKAELASLTPKVEKRIAPAIELEADPKPHGGIVPAEARKRYGQLKAFTGPDADEKAFRSGKWLRAHIFKDQRAVRWCQNHGVETRALSEGVNTAGGSLVPEEFQAAIIDLREQYGVFRRECSVIPMGRDLIAIPRVTGGTAAAFIGENQTVTESQPTWDNVELIAKKLGILTRMSSELAEDAVINLADFLAMDMARAFALKEDQCGFTGTGTSTFGGISGLTFLLNGASGLAGAYDTPGIDLFTEITTAHLSALMSLLPEYARGSAKFYCSAVGHDLVFQRLAAAAGGNTIQTLSGSFAPAYLGYPIIISQVLPTTTGAQDEEVMLLFGDLGMAATLGDRRQISVQTSGERYFDVDQIGIRAIERFDINCHDVGDASTAGPMVAFVGETT